MTNEKTAPQGEQKNHKKAKVLMWVGAILALFVVAGAITSLRFINREKNGEKIDTTQVEEETSSEEASVEDPSVENEIDFDLIEYGEGSQYLQWNEMGIPEVYIEYTSGLIGRPEPEFEWQADGVPNFITIFGSNENALGDYVNMAVRQGWDLERERLADGSEDDSWSISKVEDNTLHSVQLSWHNGDSSYVILILTSTSLEEQAEE